MALVPKVSDLAGLAVAASLLLSAGAVTQAQSGNPAPPVSQRPRSRKTSCPSCSDRVSSAIGPARPRRCR